MSETPKHRWSFSLRTLFVMVTVVGCWLAWNLQQIETREALLQSVHDRHGSILIYGENYENPPKGNLPLIWTMLGAKPVAAIDLPDDLFDSPVRARIERYFPEADVRESFEGSIIF